MAWVVLVVAVVGADWLLGEGPGEDHATGEGVCGGGRGEAEWGRAPEAGAGDRVDECGDGCCCRLPVRGGGASPLLVVGGTVELTSTCGEGTGPSSPAAAESAVLSLEPRQP